MNRELEKLKSAIVKGDSERAIQVAEDLISNGVDIKSIIQDGLTASLRYLDVKCTTEEFNLLEIMLAGRAMMAVMDEVIARHLVCFDETEHDPDSTIIIGTIKGDIHELGKHVVKMLLKANGFKVIDLGKDVSPTAFVKAAVMEGASYIGVSSLITLTIPYIREIKEILSKEGLNNIVVLAGGAAIQQTDPEELNVDYVANDAFDAIHYLNSLKDVLKAFE